MSTRRAVLGGISFSAIAAVAQAQSLICFGGSDLQPGAGMLETCGPSTPSYLNKAFASSGATFPWYSNDGGPSYDSNTNKTWAAWEGWSFATNTRDVKIRVFDHASHTWGLIYVISNNTLITDDHGVPSTPTRDADGYWHVFYGPHNGVLRHSVTTLPDDPSAWTELATITSPNDGYTYPDCVLVGSALFLFLRDYVAATGSFQGVVVKSTAVAAGVVTWGTQKAIVIFTGRRFYKSRAIVRGTDILFAATNAEFTNATRQDIFYFIYRSASGNISNIDNSVTTLAASLPINTATANASYRVHATALASTMIPQMNLDTSNNPHIIYSESDLTNATVYHTAYIGGAFTTPQALGTTANIGSDNQDGTVVPLAGGAVQAYWTQTDNHSYPDGTYGGDLWTASRTAGGVWSSSAMFVSAPNLQLDEPVWVRSGVAEFNLAFEQVWNNTADTTPPVGFLKTWAYGTGGFLTPTVAQGYPSWLPLASGVPPVWGSAFDQQQYWYNDAVYTNLAVWGGDTNFTYTAARRQSVGGDSFAGYTTNAAGNLALQGATTANVLRTDYDPVSLAALGALIEGSVSAYFRPNQDMQGWNQSGATVVANAVTAPDGSGAGQKVKEDSSTGEHIAYKAFTAIAGDFLHTVFAKPAGRNWMRFGDVTGADFGVSYNIQSGAVGHVDAGFSAASIALRNNGFYLASFVRTLTAATWNPLLQPMTADNTPSYAGDGNSGIYAWGTNVTSPYLYETSYIGIALAATPVIRPADVLVRTRAAPSVTSKIIKGRTANGAGTQVCWQIDDGSEANRVRVYRSSDMHLHVVVTAGSVDQCDLDMGVVANRTDFRLTFRLQANDFSASLNGATPVTDASGTMPAGITTERWGRDSAGNYWNAWMLADFEWPSALANAELQTLSA